MKLTILIQGAHYQAVWSVAFMGWQGPEIFSGFKLKLEPTSCSPAPRRGLGGLLFCKEGRAEREATSQAKCPAGITSGGNHTWGSERLFIWGAIQAGFLGMRPRLKRLVPEFLYLSTCSSLTLSDSPSPCRALGKHPAQRKTSGRKGNGKREAFTSQKPATPI